MTTWAIVRELRTPVTLGRRRIQEDHLLRIGRHQAESSARQRVDPLRVGQGSLLEAELAVPLFQHCPLALEFLNPIAIPHAIEMLARVKQPKNKSQGHEPEQAVTLPKLGPVDFAAQSAVVDAFDVIRMQDRRAACRGLVPRPPGSGSYGICSASW